MDRKLQPEDLYALRLVEDPRIGPDAAHIAYVVVGIDRPSYEYRRAISVVPVSGGEARPLLRAPTTPLRAGRRTGAGSPSYGPPPES